MADRAGRMPDAKGQVRAPRLVIMVKQPVAGNVKTRLGRDIGSCGAAAFYRHTLSNVVKRMACDRRWLTLLSVSPASAIEAPVWPLGVPRMPQCAGDIGVRMQAIFNRVPPGPVVIIGTDIPGAAPAHIAEAFHMLGRNDMVFGPATDGGFWLVGMRRSPRIIAAFAGAIRWSAPETLDDCLAGLSHLGVATAATLRDVDSAVDLALLSGVVGRRVLPARGSSRRTIKLD